MKRKFFRCLLCSAFLAGFVLVSSCGTAQESQTAASVSQSKEDSSASVSRSEEDSSASVSRSEEDSSASISRSEENSPLSSSQEDTGADDAAFVTPAADSTPEPFAPPDDTAAASDPSPTPQAEESGESAGVISASDPESTQPPASNGHVVAIDPGHQARGNSEQEPIGPGASETKAKVASGTSGTASGVPENELNLSVSLKLREELESRGYQVVMIRETADVDISNAERAEIANQSGAEIFVRIHANGDSNSSVAGALTMAPSQSNPYVGQIASQCQTLSQCVIDAYCSATGFRNRGVLTVDNMSGINWCTIPVTIVEMGFMTNPEEDMQMQDETMQYTMASGIADGIDAYFGI